MVNGLYASTLPLEDLTVIASVVATHGGARGRHGERCRRIRVHDVRRAYFDAEAARNLHIELPAEDSRGGPHQLGKLNLPLYGTQDAAATWESTLAKRMDTLGFVRGRGHRCVFAHRERGVLTMVHGDDYVSVGFESELQ